jgi:hypothetical protein
MTDFEIPREVLRKQVQRAAFAKIEDMVLNNKGIIYGGYVRDMMIVEEHTRRFRANHPGLSNKLWDSSFAPETQGRHLIPSDMDICFYTVEEADDFIASLRNVREFTDVCSSNMYNSYYSPNIQCVKHVLIYINKIGYIPFLSPGITIAIQLDLVIPNAKIEPPFNNLDMLCNGFIKTQNDNYVREVKFSMHTGTILDNYTQAQRMQVISGIAKDLVEFKTHICFTSSCTSMRRYFNVMALRRVLKMYNKNIPWTLSNCPIKMSTEHSQAHDECCICYDTIKEGQQIMQSLCKKDNQEVVGCKMHYKCSIKYLHNEKHKAIQETNPTSSVILLKCPFRNPIDFRHCGLNIDNLYL